MTIKVTPRARREGIEAVGPDGALRVKVTAPPEDGKANTAVIVILAQAWDVPKSSLSIVSGHASRQKRVHVRGAPADLMRALTARLGA